MVANNGITSLSMPHLISTNTIHVASNLELEYANFDSLNHTSMHLHFITNPRLTSIVASSLKAIGVGEGEEGDLHLMGNTAMTSYEFPSLELVGEDVEMFYSPWLESVQFPELEVVTEDFELHYFLNLKEVTLPQLNSTGEDLEIWDLPAVRVVSLPKFESVGEDFEVFDCLLLEKLEIPALHTVEEDFDFYVNREVTFLGAPSLKHIWEDIQLFGNDHLEEVSFPVPKDIAFEEGGGFLITTNRKLKTLSFPSLVLLWIDLSGLEQLGNLTYFIVRHNSAPQQGSLSIEGLSTSNNSPILSNLLCNSPEFCVEPPTPDWLTPTCFGSDVNNFCPEDTTFPTTMCNSSATCTDAYYLWARENDYDFEENVVQLSGPPQFSGVEWKRKQRYVRGVGPSWISFEMA